jgi:hypothetical protein
MKIYGCMIRITEAGLVLTNCKEPSVCSNSLLYSCCQFNNESILSCV